MDDHLFTRLHIATEAPRYALLRRVAQRLGGAVVGTTVVAGDFVVDLRENRELPPALTAEVVSESMPLAAYLANVAAVMLSLHEIGATVVAACDWEDQLPGGGKLGV